MAQRSRAEAAYWSEQISQLEQHKVRLGNLTVNVTFRLLLTMIDGKVQAAITETSSTAVCTVCQAKPSQFNQLRQVAERVYGQRFRHQVDSTSQRQLFARIEEYMASALEESPAAEELVELDRVPSRPATEDDESSED
ncbi:hypothetical protein FJT64_017813 [Amphibalanus amphitrite]|uniref:Uncharacterized protein n=1 Tax=Amphibalanus amphitrite TaxID=1232801 RepID=A0A6A4X1K6_AMPAM|nr:hypothetical protein FJT64_017813 [Amphibalanus amphitrite]